MSPNNSRWKDDLVFAIVVYIFLFYYAFHIVSACCATTLAEALPNATLSPWGTTTVEVASKLAWWEYLAKGFDHMYSTPFAILPTSWQIIPAMFICLIVDAVITFFWDTAMQTRRADAPGKEHGSAQWNKNIPLYKKEFTAPYNPSTDPFDKNIIMSKNVELNLDNKAVNRNMNVLVIGGAGTGKSWRVIKPNIAQMNCSMIVTDPSGELFACTGKMLMNNGIKVRMFSTSDMVHSNCYNPFDYVYDENGALDEVKVSTMVALFLKNADNLSSGKSASGDPFWTKSAKAFISSLVYYLLESPNIDKRDINFSQVLRLTQAGRVSENSDNAQSGLDLIMDEHREKMKEMKRDSKAIINYDTFKLAPAKTANSILISAAVDLQLFGDDKVKDLTRTDYDDPENNVCLDKLGDEQTVLFINTPQANSTYNFLVSMLYSQTFDALYTKAEKIYPYKYMLVDKFGSPVITMIDSQKEAENTLGLLKTAKVHEAKNARGAIRYEIRSGKKVIATRPTRQSAEKIIEHAGEYKVKQGSRRLPWHLRCLMDEFANIGEIPDFAQLLSTMRKYEISCTIVLQAIAQLKARYKDDHPTIIGNCDTILFLGSSETETLEFISKLLGDTTVRTRNVSLNAKGGSESYSYTKRVLLTPQEVGSINKGHGNKCIIRIRDVDPFLDEKYDFRQHPNYSQTGDADHRNEIDEDYLDTYFNTKPVQKKEVKSKRNKQGAVSEAMGKAKVKDLKAMDEIAKEAGIEDGDVNKVFQFETSAMNIKNMVDYKGPEAKDGSKQAAKTAGANKTESGGKAGKGKAPEGILKQAGGAENNGGRMDDTVFMF